MAAPADQPLVSHEATDEGAPSFAFGTADCALFSKYPEKIPFRDDSVPPEDKAKFKDIWTRLKGIAGWLADTADVGVPLASEVSHYAQNGRSQTDLWSCAYPKSVPNKSYGLQVAIIISASGAELCFCLGAGRSTLQGDAEEAAKSALGGLRDALKSVSPEIVAKVDAARKPDWDLRKQWRKPVGTSDFPDLSSWLAFASSPDGDGASISRNLSVDELEAIGTDIAHELAVLAKAFAPIVDYAYGEGTESALKRALNEYEAEWDEPKLSKTQASFEIHRERFDELFGTLEAVEELTAEDFFGFLNELDSHVSPETGLFTLGPGLPAPKDPSLPTWQALVEDLPKLRAAISQLLFGDPDGDLAGRIDAMLALPAPRRYITPQLALTSILLCLRDPEHHSGVQRMPKKEEKLNAMGLLPHLSETASVGTRFLAYEEVLSSLSVANGKDWDWAKRDGFYWSEAFSRNLANGETNTPDEASAIVESGLSRVAAAAYLPTSFLRNVIELLEEKRQVIFFGPPGTGKTFIAQRLIAWLAPLAEQREVVQFHPSYSYEDFVIGYRPTLTENSELAYSLHRGPLLRIAARALANPDKRFVLLIDEINRGNLPRIFGELLYLLEYRDERIALMYSPSGTREPNDPIDAEGRFALPSNLWIIGTMNTADRSIGLIDAALRRRFHFVPFFPEEGALDGLLRRWLEDTQSPDMQQVAVWVSRLNALLRDHFGRHLQVGHSYFMRPTLKPPDVQRIWDTDIIPFLEDQLMGKSDDLKPFKLDTIKAVEIDPGTAIEGGAADGAGSGSSDEVVYADDTAP